MNESNNMEPSAPLTPQERQEFEALKAAARELVIDWESAGYVPKDSIIKLREILKS